MPTNCNNQLSNCTSTVGPNFNQPDDSNQNGCSIPTEGKPSCPPTSNPDKTCSPFQLDKNRDSCFIDSLVNENLNIGAATFNVYNLLGVHEQGKLIDCVGLGSPLSNGDTPQFPASNAFDAYVTEWRSIQEGAAVISSAYIGYDFGEIKTNDDSRRAYGVDTSVYKHITAIGIKQSEKQSRRVTRARIERSEDGNKWYGVSIVDLPDDDCLNTILFRSSVPSRYWRIRPIDFNGSDVNEVWSVQALQLFHNYEATDQYNIQDKVLLENRDREYNIDPVVIKGSYDLVDVSSELTRFGIELPSQSIYAQVSFSACVAILGRPIVIGDIIEIPSEAQYSSEMKRIKKWMEVTDVSWSTEGYTPGWQPTLLRLILQPAFVSQETQDIFGDLANQQVDDTGLFSGEDGNSSIYQDYFDIDQTIKAEAKDAVPERGSEGSNSIRAFEEEELIAAAESGVTNLNKLGLNSTGLYVEDAMPPNNKPFTEGDEYPENPNNGDYHRLTYSGLAGDIPARLYRYSSSKNRWIYLETDKRSQMDHNKPLLQEFLTSPNRVADDEISYDRDRIDKDCSEE